MNSVILKRFLCFMVVAPLILISLALPASCKHTSSIRPLASAENEERRLLPENWPYSRKRTSDLMVKIAYLANPTNKQARTRVLTTLGNALRKDKDAPVLRADLMASRAIIRLLAAEGIYDPKRPETIPNTIMLVELATELAFRQVEAMINEMWQLTPPPGLSDI